MRALNKLEKTGAALGAVLTLASGGAAVKAYENIQNYDQACARAGLSEAACRAAPPRQAEAENVLGIGLGFGAALGIGAGIMTMAVALGSSEEKRAPVIPMAAEAPAGAGTVPTAQAPELPLPVSHTTA